MLEWWTINPLLTFKRNSIYADCCNKASYATVTDKKKIVLVSKKPGVEVGGWELSAETAHNA